MEGKTARSISTGNISLEEETDEGEDSKEHKYRYYIFAMTNKHCGRKEKSILIG